MVLAEVDLATRKVVRSVTLPDGRAEGEPEGGWAATVSGGKIYVGTYPSPDLYSFDPATGQVEHLHFEPGSWKAWAMAGRDLARIRLDPRCPAVDASS